MSADYVFSNHGSIWLCEAQTDQATEHLQNYIGEDALFTDVIRLDGQRGQGVVVEPRYVEGLAAMLEDDGWSVEL